jgi:serine/threonine protein kinase
MGVVWKARDTHLDRFVALKMLPMEKLADPERKRRSVQEATAASTQLSASFMDAASECNVKESGPFSAAPLM